MDTYDFIGKLFKTDEPENIYAGYFETPIVPPRLYEDTDISYKKKVMYCVNNNKPFEELTPEENAQFYPEEEATEGVVFY